MSTQTGTSKAARTARKREKERLTRKVRREVKRQLEALVQEHQGKEK